MATQHAEMEVTRWSITFSQPVNDNLIRIANWQAPYSTVWLFKGCAPHHSDSVPRGERFADFSTT
jgi:hypothetical protein